MNWQDEIVAIQKKISLTTPTALIVEPDPRLQMVYSFFLSSRGFLALPFTGTEAYQWLVTATPQQMYRSLLLIDTSVQNLETVLVASTYLTQPPLLIGMHWPENTIQHPTLDMLLEKPLHLKDLQFLR